MKHIITATVENQPGVLARIVGLISGRGFNIETLNVAPTQEPNISRMTMTVPGDDRVLEQVTKQLNKLVDVIKVTDLTTEKYLDRELVLMEVAAPAQRRSEILEIVRLVKAEIAAVQVKSLTIQMVGGKDEVDEFLLLMKPYKVLSLARSGAIAVGRH